MTEDQESSSRKPFPIKRIALVIALIALVIFLLFETLGTTAEVENSMGRMLTSV